MPAGFIDVPTVLGEVENALSPKYFFLIRVHRHTPWLPSSDDKSVRQVRTYLQIDSAAIGRMKRGAGLVNMARGAIVDASALISALESGYLSGAILDVFDPEPLPVNSPIWSAPNLIVTPHCSSDDADEYVPRTLDLIFDNIRSLLAERPLRAQINLALEY